MQESTRTRSKIRRKNKGQIDYTLLVIVAFMLAFGLIMVYSASSYNATLTTGDSLYYLKKQAASALIGIVAIFLICKIGYKVLKRFAWVLYFIAIGLCGYVLFFGRTINNSSRWIYIGPISFQPSEIAKVALIILLAYVISKNPARLRNAKDLIITAVIIIGPLFVLVAINNLSTAIIILLIGGTMLFISSPKIWPFVAVAIIGGIGAIAFALTAGYRTARINAWLDPEHHDAYQTMQALYAIGSGGLFGKGLGESVQKQGFVPEAQNDMVFSIICEELGIFGAICVIAMFVVLVWRLVVIAIHAKDMFGSFLVIGVAAHISLQVILNVAVVTNTIPNTGVILPFISYGGTSLAILLFEMGIALSVSKGVDVDEE
ncbi:MAG: cell division protein FtsW [Lachnospiraceae bacterium]|nr:cell division protein FtsW [Lachnospiraceae bacterium]MBQ9390897.1 cell division protein FtsW [Lachnospiraceae bacterium]